MTTALRKRLARVRLFLCDVDGVLTDGGIWMGFGQEFKRFHLPDGLALRLLQKEGVRVGWISRRPSATTEQRAEDLGIDFLRQVDDDKVPAAGEILEATGLGWSDVCWMGDDLVDLGLMRLAGTAVAPPNAIVEVQRLAHYITRAPGGFGAVREIVEMILRAQGRWRKLVESHSKP